MAPTFPEALRTWPSARSGDSDERTKHEDVTAPGAQSTARSPSHSRRALRQPGAPPSTTSTGAASATRRSPPPQLGWAPCGPGPDYRALGTKVRHRPNRRSSSRSGIAFPCAAERCGVYHKFRVASCFPIRDQNGHVSGSAAARGPLCQYLSSRDSCCSTRVGRCTSSDRAKGPIGVRLLSSRGRTRTRADGTWPVFDNCLLSLGTALTPGQSRC